MRPDPGWQSMLDEYGAVEFVPSRVVALRMLGWSALFCLVGMWLIFHGALVQNVVGYLAILIFGVAAMPVIVVRLITGNPKLCVDLDGLSFGPERVSWDEVLDVKTSGVRRAKSVGVVLTPQANRRVKAQLGPIQRFIEKRNERFFGGSAMTILNLSGFDPDTMAEWLTELQRSRFGP